jgi:hypothetical protein
LTRFGYAAYGQGRKDHPRPARGNRKAQMKT